MIVRVVARNASEARHMADKAVDYKRSLTASAVWHVDKSGHRAYTFRAGPGGA